MKSTELHRSMVICIAGALAGGKTTLVHALAEKLGGAAVLLFDDYDAFAEWPANTNEWIAQGADPSRIRVPRLLQDLESLLDGRPVRHPIDGRTISPSPIVLLEDPTGRTRPEIRKLIDLVLFVDLPIDLSVLRMTRRALGLAPSTTVEDLSGLTAADLQGRIAAALQWLDNYEARRTMYTTLAEPVRASADVILDGAQPVESVLGDALHVIERALGASG